MPSSIRARSTSDSPQPRRTDVTSSGPGCGSAATPPQKMAAASRARPFASACQPSSSAGDDTPVTGARHRGPRLATAFAGPKRRIIERRHDHSKPRRAASAATGCPAEPPRRRGAREIRPPVVPARGAPRPNARGTRRPRLPDRTAATVAASARRFPTRQRDPRRRHRRAGWAVLPGEPARRRVETARHRDRRAAPASGRAGAEPGRAVPGARPDIPRTARDAGSHAPPWPGASSHPRLVPQRRGRPLDSTRACRWPRYPLECGRRLEPQADGSIERAPSPVSRRPDELRVNLLVSVDQLGARAVGGPPCHATVIANTVQIADVPRLKSACPQPALDRHWNARSSSRHHAARLVFLVCLDRAPLVDERVVHERDQVRVPEHDEAGAACLPPGARTFARQASHDHLDATPGRDVDPAGSVRAQESIGQPRSHAFALLRPTAVQDRDRTGARARRTWNHRDFIGAGASRRAGAEHVAGDRCEESASCTMPR